MYTIRAYSTQSPISPLAPFSFQRRDPRSQDIQIEILYCGVCHTDIHQARNEWHNTIYPCVPGHEIVGRVVKTGSEVKKFKIGDIAAVGCLMNSCRVCSSCQKGCEQYCENGAVFTYNSEDQQTGMVTFGGYSESIVVDEAFALKVPNNLDLAATAPLLCAGITVYSPLRRWQVGKGQKVGVVGLGGLGHLAVKFTNAFGAQVVVFTTSPNKAADAARLGAHDAVVSKSEDDMKKYLNSLDFILDTASANRDLSVYLRFLKYEGTLMLVGIPEKPLSVTAPSLLFNNRRLAGSVIGGIQETQEMLNFCSERQIISDIELVPIQQINRAYERLLKGDVRYRFVIDMASLKEAV